MRLSFGESVSALLLYLQEIDVVDWCVMVRDGVRAETLAAKEATGKVFEVRRQCLRNGLWQGWK